MTYATSQDVAEELGRPIASLSDEEILQFNRWLRRAEATIKVRIPTLDAMVTAGTLTAETVAGVEAAAVARKALNPEGKQSETIDDYTYRLTDAASSTDILITDAEWSLLIPAGGSDAFTISPYGVPGYRTDAVLDWS